MSPLDQILGSSEQPFYLINRESQLGLIGVDLCALVISLVQFRPPLKRAGLTYVEGDWFPRIVTSISAMDCSGTIDRVFKPS